MNRRREGAADGSRAGHRRQRFVLALGLAAVATFGVVALTRDDGSKERVTAESGGPVVPAEWTTFTGPSFGTRNGRYAVAATDGYAVFVSGFLGRSQARTLDLLTGEWTDISAIPEPLQAIAAVVDRSGRVVVVGTVCPSGVDLEGGEDLEECQDAEVHAYVLDSPRDTWTAVDAPETRFETAGTWPALAVAVGSTEEGAVFSLRTEGGRLLIVNAEARTSRVMDPPPALEGTDAVACTTQEAMFVADLRDEITLDNKVPSTGVGPIRPSVHVFRRSPTDDHWQDIGRVDATEISGDLASAFCGPGGPVVTIGGRITGRVDPETGAVVDATEPPVPGFRAAVFSYLASGVNGAAWLVSPNSGKPFELVTYGPGDKYSAETAPLPEEHLGFAWVTIGSGAVLVSADDGQEMAVAVRRFP